MSGLIYKDCFEIDIVLEHLRVNLYWGNFVCVCVVRTYDVVVVGFVGLADVGTT